jgi:hypothetical protein
MDVEKLWWWSVDDGVRGMERGGRARTYKGGGCGVLM